MILMTFIAIFLIILLVKSTDMKGSLKDGETMQVGKP